MSIISVGKYRPVRKSGMLYAYDGKHRLSDGSDAETASMSTRIESIWPYVIKETVRFQESLAPRDRANFDCDDTAAELWIALATNDKDWSPAKGRYITFAATIIARELCKIRDRARIVHSPKNSICRTREYTREIEEGTITERRLVTANAIAYTMSEVFQIDFRHTPHAVPEYDDEVVDSIPDPDAKESWQELSDREHAERSRILLARMLAECLTPLECMVLGRSLGLWYEDPQSTWKISFDMATNPEKITAIKSKAINKIRKALIDLPQYRRLMENVPS